MFVGRQVVCASILIRKRLASCLVADGTGAFLLSRTQGCVREPSRVSRDHASSFSLVDGCINAQSFGTKPT
jgi:hypothetical protein